MAGPTLPTQVSPFHSDIDLTTTHGKKLHQRATSGVPESQKHDGNLKEIFKFVEILQSSGDELGWKLAGINIGHGNLSISKLQDRLISMKSRSSVILNDITTLLITIFNCESSLIYFSFS